MWEEEGFRKRRSDLKLVRTSSSIQLTWLDLLFKGVVGTDKVKPGDAGWHPFFELFSWKGGTEKQRTDAERLRIIIILILKTLFLCGESRPHSKDRGVTDDVATHSGYLMILFSSVSWSRIPGKSKGNFASFNPNFQDKFSSPGSN